MANNITNSTSAYNYLKSSPMFKFSLSSKELFHSNFLEWLSNVNSDAFKKLINRMAGLNDDYEWPVWRVKREYNNFDLCIVAYDQYTNNSDEKIDDEEDFRIMFVIENKVKSIPYKFQLDKYHDEAETINEKYWKKAAQSKVKDYKLCIQGGKWYRFQKSRKNDIESLDVNTKITQSNKKADFYSDFCKQKNSEASIHYILLSLAKNYPDKDEINKTTWKIFNYSCLPDLINTTFGLSNYSKGMGDMNKDIILDYCGFINSLTTLSSEWENDFDFSMVFLSTNNDNYKNAKQFRIHDLYQKLKFSRLCTEMFNKVQESYGKNYIVFPSNQGGLFKEKDKEKSSNKAFICVNYTFLHGDPLLEINIHPKFGDNEFEFYYAIQVQGSAYEHGIQVKKKEVAKLSIDQAEKRLLSEIVWESLKGGSLKILDGWMNVTKTLWKKQDWMNGTQNKDYNKYDMNDGTFVYQKYIIGDETKIELIIKQMLADIEFIIDNLKKPRDV